jgi:hypothetical protein
MDRTDGPFRNAGQNLDTYEPNHGLIGQPRGCSYCGSMHPDDFMEAVRNGLEIGPTDKSYKVYVKGIPREGDPNEPRVVSHAKHQFSGSRSWKELSRAEKKAAKAYRLMPGSDPKAEFWQFMPWGETVEGKFYTAHLSPEQGDEFRALYGEGKVVVGYPYRFYNGVYIPTTARGEG